MILVDTSVWIDHLRSGDPVLAELLEQSRVVMHPMVLGELACGNLQNRRAILDTHQSNPVAEIPSRIAPRILLVYSASCTRSAIE